MKVLTAKEMKEIDRQTIEEVGIPGPVLMENAGRQIFLAIASKFPDLNKERIVIVAGKGNNGGDGLVVARHLFNQGCQPQIFLLASKKEVKGDAALNLRIAENIGLKVWEVLEERDWNELNQALGKATIIIDAIFGTGLEKPAEGIYARAIELINRSSAFKIAVDIPSGLSSDTPELIGPAIKAEMTVTLGVPKIAHVLPPAEEYVGEVIVADISLPSFLFSDEKHRVEWLEKKKILNWFMPRKRDTHKGTYGHLLILAGSMGKTGAAIMAARAALRSGAGLVTVATPKSCLPIIARSTMELMTEPLPESEEGSVSSRALARLKEILKGKDALLIGPGLSTHPETSELLSSLLPEVTLPCLIDADGLNILAQRPELLSRLPQPCILTPHPGEFSRLVQIKVGEILAQRLTLTSEFSKKYGVFLVLKGHRTIISSPDGRIFINPTGNPGMASGGSGDVLSGLAASFLMQIKDPFLAIAAAVYVHGLSGDIAKEKIGERPLVAGDLIRYLPVAIKRLEDLAKEKEEVTSLGPGLVVLSKL
ncbi:MAG: NAD(P)H-hydrate dehydratase [Candidatus Aminicenantes bacterium]|nr:NAD(P)H-hydrate dehydratase [Candidatus Aminicenantes bacterium]